MSTIRTLVTNSATTKNCSVRFLAGSSKSTKLWVSLDRLRTQLRLVKHLNHDTIRIGAVKRRAAIAMDLEWMDDGHAGRAKLLFEFLHALDAFDDEAQMIELPFFGRFQEIVGYFMDSDVVAAGREINILRVGLPNHVHTEDLLIEFF